MPMQAESPGEIYSRDYRNFMDELHNYLDGEKQLYLRSPTYVAADKKLRLMQRRMNNQLKVAEIRSTNYAQREVGRIYLQGLIQATGDPTAKLHARDDLYEIRLIQNKLESKFNKAFIMMRNETARVRMAWRPQRGENLLTTRGRQRFESRIRRDFITPRQDAREYEGYKVGPDGLEVAYTRNRRWNVNAYFNMMGRWSAQDAYNKGLVKGYERKGITVFEISDGPECGLKSHDDPTKADGKLVNAMDAKRLSLAHPNCRRVFVPRPDLTGKEPPLIDVNVQAGAVRTRLSKAYQEYTGGAGSVLARSAGRIALDTTKQTALNMAGDLIADQRFRQQAFDSVIRGNPIMRRFDDRVKQVANEMLLKTGVGHSEREVADNVVRWIDHYLEDPQRAAPPAYVRRILTGHAHGNLRKVVGGESQMDWFTMYQEALNRQEMSHFNLNVVNSIEHAYGNEWLKNLGGLTHLDEALKAHNSRYAPFSSSDPNVMTRFLQQQYKNRTTAIPNKLYKGLLKNPFDRAAENIPFMHGGKVTLVRLSSKNLTLERLGVRFRWANRFVRVQTTTVNRYRFMKPAELRRVAWSKGVPVQKVVRASKPGEIFSLIKKYKSKDNLIDEIGSNLGFLTRVTLQPHELVRLGFYWDPSLGWRKPLPSLSVRTPKIMGTRLRLNTRLNKGMVVRDPNLLPLHFRGPVRRGVNNQLRRSAAKNVTELIPDGTRVRSVTQELSITFGDALNFLNKGKLKAPRIEGIGIRTNTFVGRMESMGDVKRYMALHGAKGFAEDMTFVSMISELRVMGWGWFRIGKTLSIRPQDVPRLAKAFFEAWPEWKQHASLVTVATRLAVYERANEAQIEYLAKKVSVLDQEIRLGRMRGQSMLEEARKVRAYRALLKDKARLLEENL